MKDGYGWLFIIMGAVIAAYFIVTGPISDWLTSTEKTHVSDSHTEDLAGIDHIVIKSGSYNTAVTAMQRSDLKVELAGRSRGVNVELERKGSELHIEVKRKKFPGFHFPFFFFNDRQLRVSIPSAYSEALTLDITSGNVKVDGAGFPLQLSALSLDMTSGNMTVSDIQTESFIHDGTSGNVKINNVAASDANVKVTSGNVTVTDFRGAVKAKLTSGNFKLHVAEMTGDIEAAVTSGRLEIDLPDDAGFTVDAEVSSGNIDIAMPLQDATVSNQRKWRGTHGSGEHAVSLKASSGNIKVH